MPLIFSDNIKKLNKENSWEKQLSAATENISLLLIVFKLTFWFAFRENMPSHFKIKEYCPLVFRNLRERFGIDDIDYKESMTR